MMHTFCFFFCRFGLAIRRCFATHRLVTEMECQAFGETKHTRSSSNDTPSNTVKMTQPLLTAADRRAGRANRELIPAFWVPNEGQRMSTPRRALLKWHGTRIWRETGVVLVLKWESTGFLVLHSIHMLFYRFLQDKSGELSQVWIAAQSPNKVSKRVILDLSITVSSSPRWVMRRTAQRVLPPPSPLCRFVCGLFSSSVFRAFSKRRRSCWWRTVFAFKAPSAM